MLKITDNNFCAVEFSINGQTYKFSDVYNTHNAIYMYHQIVNREPITYGTKGETNYIAFLPDGIVLLDYEGEQFKYLYDYEEARAEIIKDLQEQIEKVIYKNYSFIESCKNEERKERFREHFLISGFCEKIMDLK